MHNAGLMVRRGASAGCYSDENSKPKIPSVSDLLSNTN